jgi:hypothetical protein
MTKDNDCREAFLQWIGKIPTSEVIDNKRELGIRIEAAREGFYAAYDAQQNRLTNALEVAMEALTDITNEDCFYDAQGRADNTLTTINEILEKTNEQHD